MWQDNNGNGIQDDGEPGINGVRVTISPGFYANPLDPNSLVTSVVTADGPAGFGAGYYLFNGVECDTDYTIAVDLSTVPSGYQATVIGAGSNAAVDSDNPAGTVVNLPLTGFDYTNPTIDFGFTAPVVCEASIGNFVFNDANNNGIQDVGELGISRSCCQPEWRRHGIVHDRNQRPVLLRQSVCGRIHRERGAHRLASRHRRRTRARTTASTATDSAPAIPRASRWARTRATTPSTSDSGKLRPPVPVLERPGMEDSPRGVAG